MFVSVSVVWVTDLRSFHDPARILTAFSKCSHLSLLTECVLRRSPVSVPTLTTGQLVHNSKLTSFIKSNYSPASSSRLFGPAIQTSVLPGCSSPRADSSKLVWLWQVTHWDCLLDTRGITWVCFRWPRAVSHFVCFVGSRGGVIWFGWRLIDQ